MTINFDKIIDYIENFEQKGISTAFLFPIGRSGSVLLQSLFDSHPQILMIPKIFPFYQMARESFTQNLNNNNIEIQLKIFFQKPILTNDWGESGNLGENKDLKLDLELDKLYHLSLKILLEYNKFDLKSVFLAIHFGYALIKGIRLEDIKVIFCHLHFSRTKLLYKTVEPGKINELIDYYFAQSDLEIKSFFSEFKNPLLFFTIRNPLDTYYSYLKLFEDKSGLIDLNQFIFSLLITYLTYYDYINLSSEFRDTFSIDLKNLHKNSINELKKLCHIMKIDYDKKLLESTIDGKTWWTGKNNDITGINPDYEDNIWKKYDKNPLFPSFIFSDILDKFNYQFPENILKQEELFSLEDYELLSLVRHLSDPQVKDIPENFIRLEEIYPLLKNVFVSYHLQNLRAKDAKASSQLNSQVTDFEAKFSNSCFYQGIEILLVNNFQHDLFNNTENACLIYIHGNQNIRINADFINKNVDQIWIIHKNMEDDLIAEGVDPDIIKIIPESISNQNIINAYINELINKKLKRFNLSEIINEYKSEENESLSARNFEKALIYQKKLSYLEPENKENIMNIVYSLIETSNYQEATDYLSVIIEENFASSEVFKLMAQCLEKTGEVDLANEYYLIAEKTDDTHG